MRTTHLFLFVPLCAFTAACGASAMPSPSKSAPMGPGATASEARPTRAESMDEERSVTPAPIAAMPAGHANAPLSRAGAPVAQSAPAAAKSAPSQASGKESTNVSVPDVFILYTGDLSVTVEEAKVAATIDRIIDAAIEAGGHIGSRRDDAVTVVVPSAAFRRTFASIEGLGEVTHRSIAAEDVSEEYHDAEVRLGNLRATRKRLEEFLSRAPSISEMLTVERELERISMDIDRIEGRMRYLREHTAFSTLTVTLHGKPKPVALVASPPPPPRALDVRASWLGELGDARLEAGK